MLTKKELAWAIIRRNYEIEVSKPEDLKNLSQGEIFRLSLGSTNLGIAFETLGLITDQECLDYLSNRGGVLFTAIFPEKVDDDNFIKVLTLRELLELLPDD